LVPDYSCQFAFTTTPPYTYPHLHITTPPFWPGHHPPPTVTTGTSPPTPRQNLPEHYHTHTFPFLGYSHCTDCPPLYIRTATHLDLTQPHSHSHHLPCPVHTHRPTHTAHTLPQHIPATGTHTPATTPATTVPPWDHHCPTTAVPPSRFGPGTPSAAPHAPHSCPLPPPCTTA